jgi:myosin-1
LDEACIVPKGDDSTFLKNINSKFSKHQHFCTFDTNSSYFAVRHYAGDVTYYANGFVDKNKDPVWKDLIVVGESSHLPIMQGMFPSMGSELLSKKRPVTAGTQFKQQVSSLMEELVKCSPHYIRCMKPNDSKSSASFDKERMLHQIRYLGLLENVRVRRAGFAFRMPFDRFMRQYKMCSKSTWPHWNHDLKDGVQHVLQDLSLSRDVDYQLGVSKVFIRNPQSVYFLEEAREKRLNELAILIQKVYRSWKARKFFLEMREKALALYKGRKLRRKRSVKLFYQGDYVQDSNHREILRIMSKRGDKAILFFDVIDKYNKSFVCQSRHILLTNRCIYFTKGGFISGKYIIKHEFQLNTAISVVMSPFPDNFLVLRIPGQGDFILSMERKTEFLQVLQSQMDLYNQKLQIEFVTECQVNVSNKKSVKLRFSYDCSKPPVMLTNIIDKQTLGIQVGNVLIASDGVIKEALNQTMDKKKQYDLNRQNYIKSGGGPPPPSVPKKQNEKLFVVLADYTASSSEELSIRHGEVLKICKMNEDGWWLAENKSGKTGFVPYTYLEEDYKTAWK